MNETRKLNALERLAVEVAICAPVKQGKYSVTAAIPWSVVNDIRRELSSCGVDWQATRKELIRIKIERSAERASLASSVR